MIDSFVYNVNINTEDLNLRENRVEDYKEAMNIIKKFEDVIKTNRKTQYFLHTNKAKIIENLRKIESLKVLLNNLK